MLHCAIHMSRNCLTQRTKWDRTDITSSSAIAERPRCRVG